MLKVYLKIFLTKLKNTYVYRNLLNNIIIIAFYLVLVALTINYLYVIILLLIYSYYLYKKNKYILFISAIISTIFIAYYIIIENMYSLKNDKIIEGYIIEVTKKSDYTKIIIKQSLFQKKIIYDYENIKLTPGDYIRVSANNINIDSLRVENGFDYALYLKRKYINQVVQAKKIEIIDHKFSLRIIRFYLYEYLEMFEENSKSFIKGVVLGDVSDFNESFSKSIQINGISHLFAVSGLHVNVLISLITKFLEKIKVSKKNIYTINSIFLFIYIVVTSFSPSILRASLLYLFTIINNLLKLNFKNSDILSFSFILLLLVNPYFMYDIGFQLSYLVTFSIILLSDLLKNKRNTYQIIFVSAFSQIITFPIIINLSNRINLLSPLINVIYIISFSLFIFPLAIFTFAFFPFSLIFEYIVIAFHRITYLLAKYCSIIITFPNFKRYIIIYYIIILLIIVFYNNKKIRFVFPSFLLIFLLLIYFAPYFNNKKEVYFLDLNNGDTIFIKDEYNKCNILIDTGDGSNEIVTKFLMSKGIRTIDYLFITHNHVDHNGEIDTILDNINVKKIVVSYYDNSFYTKQKNVIRVKKDDVIKCSNNISFYILAPFIKSNDENDNSLIIYTKIGELSYLFLGDASKAKEEELIDLNLKVDVLKIAHHGSSTSTSPKFIESIKPTYAIIMSGRLKIFNFPSTKTINTLNLYGIKYFDTKQTYSVKIENYKDKTIIHTLR